MKISEIEVQVNGRFQMELPESELAAKIDPVVYKDKFPDPKVILITEVYNINFLPSCLN